MEDFENSEFSILESNGPCRNLISGLDVRDLPVGTEFAFEEKEEELPPKEDYFNREEILKILRHDCLDAAQEIDNDDDDGDDMSPFEKIAVGMIPLMEDGGVLKKVMRAGHGEDLPKKAFVTIHYNAYLEFSDEPFDSSRLRDNPLKFVLDDGRVIVGLDIGVSSMKMREISQFLIKPDYGYGKMGCPPRIPPSAAILYEVELINFIDCAAAIEFEQMSADEKKDMTFKQMLAVCMAEHCAGNDFFKRTNLPRALVKYRKAARLMEEVSASNEEEDQQREKLLLKLYLNISLCNLGLGENKCAITYGRNALKIDPKNTKAHFRCGKALRLLGDFYESKVHLKKAQKNEPYNPEINEELMLIAKSEQKYYVLEKQFCKRIFKSGKDDDNDENDTSNNGEELMLKYKTNEDFKAVLRQKLQELIEDENLESIPFSSGFSPSDIVCIQQVAKELGLCFVHKNDGQATQIIVSKGPPAS